jgi:hypothetical protein
VGLLIVFGLWSIAMLLVGFEGVIERPMDPSFFLPWLGNGVLLLTSLIAAGVFLEVVAPDVVGNNARICMLALVSLLSLVCAKVLIYVAQVTGWISMDQAILLFPMGMAPLLATLLVSSPVGIAVGVWTSLGMALMVGAGMPVFITGMIAAVVTARMAGRVRTRAKVLQIGLMTGFAEVTVVMALTTLNWVHSDAVVVLYEAAACIFSGLFSAMATLLLLPIFEMIFRITTDITLLELSDLGHPLLQRLAMEAPGTYHHSLVVASLAQAAADEIGANSLLARVCSYFHDVGKIVKPEFFAENIHMQDNPHDDLPPSMSTLVISSHVKEGLSLAMLHKLPDPIRRVVMEHHGTSLMSCFHHKARTQMELDLRRTDMASPTTVSEEDFRYPGPKPSSRESAIICLADAVEAASRSMERKTVGHLENLVSDIINAKLEDGQLDDCDLTLAELTRVKRSFIFTLNSMLHGRLAYPKDENRDKQPAKAAGQPPEDGRPDPAPDGASPRP